MGTFGEDGKPGRRARAFGLALSLSLGLALFFAAAGSGEGPLIQAAGPNSSGYYWLPSTATVGTGGSVEFKNPSAVVPHGVRWTGGPEKPSCTGVAVEAEKTSWGGSCSFAQAGTYSFVCTVHPTEMKGTITVTSGETPPNPPPGGSTEPPLQGPASRALKISKRQRGSAVRGSIDLSPASVGGRLEITLLRRPGSLYGVGRLVKKPSHAGVLNFSVPLKRAGRRALQSAEKLPLTVRVYLAPVGGEPLTLKRGVVLHA